MEYGTDMVLLLTVLLAKRFFERVRNAVCVGNSGIGR